MAHRHADDARFLLEDAMLEDLIAGLATDNSLVEDMSTDMRDNLVQIPFPAAAIASHVVEVSLAGPDTTDSNGADTEAASETASQTSSDNGGSIVRKPMTNSTRTRMKEELSYLRAKVVELENQLETAKHNATELTTTSVHDDQENAMALLNVPQSLWERVARHQRVEKQKAERKNAELRILLEDQLKIAKSLEKALRKRPSSTLPSALLDEMDEFALSNKRLCASSELQDPATFTRLTERANKSYRDLAAIWQRLGFDTSKDECNDSQVLVDESNRLYLEVTNAKIVPFSIKATDRAAWGCISQPTLKFLNGVYRGVLATPDLIHSKSEMWMRVGSAEARMNVAIVTKRFIEKDRIVYVLESSSVGGGSRELLHNVQIIERGWVVLEPVRTRTRVGAASGDEETVESTIIQVCMRLMPAVSEDITVKIENATTGALTDLILTAFRQNLGFLFQTIENMLVEQMVMIAASDDTDVV